MLCHANKCSSYLVRNLSFSSIWKKSTQNSLNPCRSFNFLTTKQFYFRSNKYFHPCFLLAKSGLSITRRIRKSIVATVELLDLVWLLALQLMYLTSLILNFIVCEVKVIPTNRIVEINRESIWKCDLKVNLQVWCFCSY